jgi:CRISPR-associated protein Csb2
MQALLIAIRFGEGRYHGTGDWPPSPARLFQAFVAAAARGATISEADRSALSWLEQLPPPMIAAPAVRAGQAFHSYVPNNDLDAVEGDIRRTAELRVAKSIKPLLFDAHRPLLYAWQFASDPETSLRADAIVQIAARLYQLGRSTDLAWAVAETMEGEAVEGRLADHGGVLHRPANTRTKEMLLCPLPGSLKSLEDRFRAWRMRFAEHGESKKKVLLFSQPPKPRFRSVAYNAPSVRLLFDIRETAGRSADPDFAAWPLREAAALVSSIRDGIAGRLIAAFEDKAGTIRRLVVGQDATEADKPQRIRIIPLPSIGHAFVDQAIRRVLVEVPPNCPFPAATVEWAASGLDLGIDRETGEVTRAEAPVLMPAQDRRILKRYGIDEQGRRWRTVTPVALPPTAARRRLEPTRLGDRSEWKGSEERLREEGRAAASVRQALRHAGVVAEVTALAVQREPFSSRGRRAEVFAPGTRFAKERLWHVELSFAERIDGPLVVGDGRYLGLGLMQRIDEQPAQVFGFSLPATPKVSVADRDDFLHAARRALMALSREDDGSVPPLFSGHQADGGAARSGKHGHVFLAGADLDGDGALDCLLVAAPWACDRSMKADAKDAVRFDRVVSGFAMLKAGRLGVLPLQPAPVDAAIVGPARDWESHTDYRPTRHAGRGKEPAAALLRDVVAECGRRGLPRPEVELLTLNEGPKGAISARLRLNFATAVSGPILIGRDSHRGGGLLRVRG